MNTIELHPTNIDHIFLAVRLTGKDVNCKLVISDGLPTPVEVSIYMTKLRSNHILYKSDDLVWVEAGTPSVSIGDHFAKASDMMEAIQLALKNQFVRDVILE